MKRKSVLQAIDVSIGYKNKKQDAVIASGINMHLMAGSLTALIGANGIGKSTLLRTLTGIQAPFSGSIHLNGKTLADHTPSELAQNLSIVLTESLPPSNLSVFELVALGR
ncbi:MAG: ABC transporter ATP-binding protein, partial [Flavobacterium sp.]